MTALREAKNREEAVEANPLYDDFPTIDVGGFGEEQEKVKIPPLPNARYLFEITDYTCLLTGEGSKSGPGVPYVKFKCKTIDSDQKLNGRMVQTGPLMLQGPGFRFFVGDGNPNRPGFVEIIKPNRKWDVKAGVRLLQRGHAEKEAGSDYLDSFIGCKFSSETTIDVDRETGEQTGFNSMDSRSYMTP